MPGRAPVLFALSRVALGSAAHLRVWRSQVWRGSLKDEYGVVNRQIGMQRLERSVGIELAAWPFAPTEVSSADQNGSGSRGRNETHAAPLRVCGGECVTANTVYARINHGPCEIREPALLIRVTILPLLDLQQLLSPIDVCVTQQIV